MPTRATSLQNSTLTGLTREVGSKYDKIKLVADNIDAIEAVADAMAAGVKGSRITVVSSLPSTGTLGDMCYLSTTGVLYIWDGSAWESITAEGGSTGIQTVSTLPSTATTGTLVYLTTNNKLYVYNGSSWNEVGGSTIVNSEGGSIAVVPTLPVSATEGDVVYLSVDKHLYVYNGTSWSPLETGDIVVNTDWHTWTVIPNTSTWVTSQGGQVTVVDNGASNPTVTVGSGAYEVGKEAAYASDLAYIETHKNDKTSEGDFIAVLLYGMYARFFGRKPEVAGFVYWFKEAIAKNYTEYQLGLTIYNAGKSAITTPPTTNDSGGIFVDERPSTPNIGDTVLNILDGSVSTWDGTQWVVEEYTPHASSMTAVAVVSALPATASEGDIVYNTTDDKMYVYLNGAWVAYFETLTTTASGTGIEIVTILPLTVTNGKVIFSSADKKLYEGVNGSWVQVVQPTSAATEVADASITVAKFASGIKPVEVVSVLPTEGNSVGRVVYLTTDGQLYRYTASGFTTAVPAQALTGTITSTQIADDAITTPKIAAGAITADEIGANAITAGKIAANAVTAGTIAASAVGADQIAANAITTAKLYAAAITSDKIASNAIIADKIASNAITATKITADAINAGHIQAGAIGASEIAAGAITADKIASKSITAAQIQAGAISANEIATNAITASHILAGSITASKLSVDALDGKSGAFTGSRAYASSGYWTITAANSTTGSGNGGIHALGSGYGVVGNATTGWGVLGYGGGDGGVRGYSTATGVGVIGESSNGFGVHGLTSRADSQWGLYTPDKTYSAGGYSPFTGSHIVYSKDKTLKQGMVVSSNDAWCINIDQTLIHIEKAKLKAKNVVGVVSYVKNTLMDNIENNPMIKEEHKPYIDYMKNNGFFEVEINSLGEGGILVSSTNGNIGNGDYLVSDNRGYAMKQDDDLLHNYTVAKALESVDWSKETTTSKMIACTYHCG